MHAAKQVIKLAFHPLGIVPWLKDWGEIMQPALITLLIGSGIIHTAVFKTPWGGIAASVIFAALVFIAAVRIQSNLEATERKLLPGLDLCYDPNDPLCRYVENTGDRKSRGIYVTCRVKVKSLGSQTVDDVRVVLLHGDTGAFYGGVFRPMSASYRETGEFSLHPKGHVYVNILAWHAVELGENRIQSYPSWILQKQPGARVPRQIKKGVLRLRAEGRDVQACEAEFFTEVVDNPDDPFSPSRLHFVRILKQ